MTETATKSRPILFSAPMVRAILDGRKTQTRRVVKFDPSSGYIVEPGGKRRWHRDDPKAVAACPYGTTGDELWVREAIDASEELFLPEYVADRAEIDVSTIAAIMGQDLTLPARVIPSIHMPRWASRITLTIKNVRVERLQDISESDARAEGCEPVDMYCPTENHCPPGSYSYVEGFAALWESINGAGSWQANPWVWVVEFERRAGT